MLNNSISVSVSASRASFMFRAGSYWFSAVAHTCDHDLLGGVLAIDSCDCIYVFRGRDAMRLAYECGKANAKVAAYYKSFP